MREGCCENCKYWVSMLHSALRINADTKKEREMGHPSSQCYSLNESPNYTGKWDARGEKREG